jgi:hypothetical protein
MKRAGSHHRRDERSPVLRGSAAMASPILLVASPLHPPGPSRTRARPHPPLPHPAQRTVSGKTSKSLERDRPLAAGTAAGTTSLESTERFQYLCIPRVLTRLEPPAHLLVLQRVDPGESTDRGLVQPDRPRR